AASTSCGATSCGSTACPTAPASAARSSTRAWPGGPTRAAPATASASTCTSSTTTAVRWCPSNDRGPRGGAGRRAGRGAGGRRGHRAAPALRRRVPRDLELRGRRPAADPAAGAAGQRPLGGDGHRGRAAAGGDWLVVERVEGETIPRRILRDDDFAAARPKLAAQCGDALARIHAIPPASVPGLAGGDQLDQLRRTLDGLGDPHPALELGFRWLERHRPPPTAATVVHGDFRNGNLVVGPDGLRAVLDWELAHLGDPLEDLGWLCVRAWRFGAAPRVGGFGTVDELVGAYEATAGRTVDRDALHWWEVLGTLKWGIICMLQAATHLQGVVRSIELAAIGRRVCE